MPGFGSLFFDNIDSIKTLSQQLFSPSVPQMLSDPTLHTRAYAKKKEALEFDAKQKVKDIGEKKHEADVEIVMWGSKYNVPRAVLQAMLANVSQQAVEAINTADKIYATNSYLMQANEQQAMYSRINQQRMTDYSIQKAKRANLVNNIFTGIKLISGLTGLF